MDLLLIVSAVLWICFMSLLLWTIERLDKAMDRIRKLETSCDVS